jgi:mono/diheme cytochrome c family protein
MTAHGKFCLRLRLKSGIMRITMQRIAVSILFGLALAALVSAKMTPEQVASLPPPASRPVSFAQDIKPIFEASCIKCHGRGQGKGGFRLDSRKTLLNGGDSGPAVVVGKSAESYLIELVSGVDPDNVMPVKGSRLTREQVGLLRAWIDQGAAWDAAISFGKRPPVNLQPRRPTLPAVPAGESPVDAILRAYCASNRLALPAPVEDRVFARRAYLDVIGLLPSAQELDAFLADTRPDKRAQLIRRLLADSQRYAEHWLSFWNDLLRNDYRGTGYIDGGRKQITPWLFAALATNMPYDRFVAQLVNPTPASEGFAKGIVWRGVVNSSQTPQMQAAQNIGQVFMGVNLKCASCHDSFINDWTLADAYGLASVYNDGPLEMFLCDKPTGRKATVKFMYPEVGALKDTTNRAERLQSLADLMTCEKNGRLSRTVVNRLWARFFGRGLVEPVDDMEQPAWCPDLLDWLAEDFVAHGYDLRHAIAQMLTAQAYQWPAVALDEQAKKDFVFRGPGVRRLTAEQFRDALGQLTGEWYAQPAGEFDFTCLQPGGPHAGPAHTAKWIWTEPGAAQRTAPATVFFRKVISLAGAPDEATAVVSCDNSFTLYVNGQRAGEGKDFTKPAQINLRPHLKAGDNVLAVVAINHLPDNSVPSADKPAPDSAANPAGLYLHASIRAKGVTQEVGTEASWRWSATRSDGWQRAGFNDSGWQPAAELGDAGMAPWNLARSLQQMTLAAQFKGRTRAALAVADPLAVALGRPNREQVNTTRPTAATTLQALELTNGDTLAKLLARGAARLTGNPTASEVLVEQLYRQALGRAPTGTERAVALELVGQPAKKEGVEDLLWAMTMLPEFQLVY